MENKRLSFMLLCVAMMIPLSGCTQSLVGCGAGYDEMYGGYDYIYSTKDVASDNSLNVTVKLLKSGGGWLEDSEQNEESQSIWVTLTIKMDDGSEVKVGYNSNTWEVNGDSWDEMFWSTNLYYQSPVGFCDDGCDRVTFSASVENGAIYYDGTCDTSPWIDI